ALSRPGACGRIRDSRPARSKNIATTAGRKRFDDDVADMMRSNLLGLRCEAEKRIELALDEELKWIRRGVGRRDPADVLGRVEPDVSGDQDQLRRRARLQADGLPLQLGDAANALTREQ